MKIGLIDVDSKIANLALMKISAYHKAKGDDVEWYSIFSNYDIVYKSKVFSFTPDFDQIIGNANEVRQGGTGYGWDNQLPHDIDRIQPDYTIYPNWPKDTALGFLTRGCPNRCGWCIVPKKEGAIVPYMTIDEVTDDFRLKKAVLMDNNILAAGDYAVEQLERIAEHGTRIDFNQAMDARLVTDDFAKLLARCRWIKDVRFGCDTPAQISACELAIGLMNKYGYKGEFLLYTIIQGDLLECYNRIAYWKRNKKCRCVAQPRLNLTGRTIIPKWQSDLARWANRREFYTQCDFKEFSPRKAFKCQTYFN